MLRGRPRRWGTLPEWDLSHLYPAMDSPVFASDLDKAHAESQNFAALYRGKLGALAERADASRAAHRGGQDPMSA